MLTRKEQLQRFFNKAGSLVTVTPKFGRQIKVKAIIQPLRKNVVPGFNEIENIGSDYKDDVMYYMGPTSCRLDKYMSGTSVYIYNDDLNYMVIRAKCVCIGNKPLYVFAVLRQSPS